MHNNHSIKSRGCPGFKLESLDCDFCSAQFCCGVGSVVATWAKGKCPQPHFAWSHGVSVKAPNLYRLRWFHAHISVVRFSEKVSLTHGIQGKHKKVEHINLQEKTEKMASELCASEVQTCLFQGLVCQLPWNL